MKLCAAFPACAIFYGDRRRAGFFRLWEAWMERPSGPLHPRSSAPLYILLEIVLIGRDLLHSRILRWLVWRDGERSGLGRHRVRRCLHAGLAQNRLELRGVDGLLAAQLLSDAIKGRAMRLHDLNRLGVAGAHNAIDLLIDQLKIGRASCRERG